jgi:Reverse transcriptase (RNA-dependent DNA polymerase)
LVPDITKALSHEMEPPNQLKNLNNSYITLIPKTESANKPGEFRPISLINGIQRILSKVLAARLQPFMLELVQNAQTGFIRGRQITEGFLYAQTVIREAKRTRTHLFIFKADIHKTFDTLNWKFIIQILKARGFPEKWIEMPRYSSSNLQREMPQ